MEVRGHRYCYSLLRRHAWRDMWPRGGRLSPWRTWSVRQTLRFMVTDTIKDALGFIEH